MLTKPDYRQIAGLEAASDRNTLGIGFQREILGEIPFINDDYNTLVSTYSYTNLYPQAMCFDDVARELFVLRATSSAGANQWGWVFVYDSDTLEYKSAFTLGLDWAESIVVRYEGTSRFVYLLAGSGGTLRKADITALPANLAVVSSTDTGVVGYTHFTYNGMNWVVQDRIGTSGGFRRNAFTLYDSALSEVVGHVTFPFDVIGDLNGYIDNLPKMQSIAAYRGGYVFGCGATWSNDGLHDATLPTMFSGIQACSADGRLTMQALARPDRAREIYAAALGYTTTLVENEGIAVHDGNVCALWVMIGATTAATAGYENHGFIITRELSHAANRLDFSSAGVTYGALDVTAINSTVFNNNSAQLTNPITGDALDSFADIVAYMRAAGLSRFAFSGTGQTLTDLNGASVFIDGALVEFISTNGSTFLVEVRALSDKNCQAFWLHTNGTVQVNIAAPRSIHRSGTGSPEGAETAPIGATYSRLDGGAGTTFYVKESGTGNTGWVAK